MPRLHEDFLNSPVTLSSSNSSRKVSPSPQPQSPSEEPSLPSMPNASFDAEDTLETPKRGTFSRAVRSHVPSSVGLSLASIREESRSYEERSYEISDTKTPVPQDSHIRSRFSSSSDSEEHSDGRASRGSETERRRPATINSLLSPSGTPSESPPPSENV